MGEQQRLVYLQHYVSGIEELARVYYDDKRDQVVHSRPPMGYHKYLELLMHYATHVDTSQNMNADTSNYQRSTRSINSHNWHHYEEEADHDTSLLTDTDYDSSPLQVNAHQFRPSMGRDQWNALSDPARQTWDKLDDDSKAIILGYNKPGNKPSSGRPKPKPILKKPSRSVNFHEIESQDSNDTAETETETDTAQEEDQQDECQDCTTDDLSLIHISEPTRRS